jgi:hypothetical protein
MERIDPIAHSCNATRFINPIAHFSVGVDADGRRRFREDEKASVEREKERVDSILARNGASDDDRSCVVCD